MNWAHIEGVVRGTRTRRCKRAGQILLTNGHIAMPFGNEFYMPEEFEDYERLDELWNKALSCSRAPSPLGGLYLHNGLIYRELDGAMIDERFIRCFDRPEVTWTSTGPEAMFLVHDSRNLVALGMPARANRETPVASASDTDVFGPFACQDNGVYLASKTRIDSLLKEELVEIARLESRIDEAQHEIDERQLDVNKFKKLLKSMNEESAPAATQGAAK